MVLVAVGRIVAVVVILFASSVVVVVSSVSRVGSVRPFDSTIVVSDPVVEIGIGTKGVDNDADATIGWWLVVVVVVTRATIF